MTDSLGNCPFCGGDAIRCENQTAPPAMFWTQCVRCHACPGDRSTRAEADAAWNTRANSPEALRVTADELRDVFERPFDGEDDPRLRVARVLTRAEADAVLEHRGDLIAALSAASPNPPQTEEGWRPIESAPRDGTLILICRPDEQFPEDRYHVVQWTTDHFDEGFWTVNSGKDTYPLRRSEPTHWRPLPPPPLQQVQDGSSAGLEGE